VTTAAERQQARLSGSTKAIQRTMRLNLDPSRQVDIFKVIENEPVWLFFEPLRDLYGFFDRQDDNPGIVIQSKHPLSLQRFTGAHEYGHFICGHSHSQDTRRELFTSSPDLELQEIEAQAFAAEFLMPLALVNRALARLDLPDAPQGLSALGAYQVALELGSSYLATITQLRQLNKITDADLARLEQSTPIDIKVEIAGRRPDDPRSDVWLVDDRMRSRALALRPGDELHVRLPEIPSSGYRWRLAPGASADSLELIEDELEPLDLLGSRRIGAQRSRHVSWRATAPGAGTLGLLLERPRQAPGVEAKDELEVDFLVHEPAVDPEIGRGMTRRQRRGFVQMHTAG